MAYSSGVFSLVSGNPVVTGTTISSTWANNTLTDIASNGLSLCVLKDGSQTIIAPIPLNGNRLTGLGAPTTTADALSEGRAIGATTPAAGTFTTVAVTSQALADQVTVTWNVNSGALATWTMGGSRTLSNPTNIKAGASYLLQITQDGTGGRLVTWGSAYLGVNGAFQPQQPNPSASAVTEYYFFSPNGTSLYLIAPCVQQFGQCKLTLSAGNLKLSPFKGNLLTINGKAEVIPDAGVTLAPPAVASTLYYIYAFMSAGVMTLENSVTAYATQAGTGITIKSADPTRTLVGMARTTAGNAWADSATQRFTRSFFNDPGIASNNRFTASRSTASATAVELNTEIRCEFIIWSGEPIDGFANGQASSTTAQLANWGVTYDGTTYDYATGSGSDSTSGWTNSVGCAAPALALAEGYHYATLTGQIAGGATLVFVGGSVGTAGLTTVGISSPGNS